MSTLWMGDLDSYMDEAFVTNAFAAMGESVVSVKMIKHRTTGAPAGYCFVEFPDSASAQKALSKLNGLPVSGTNPVKRYKLNWATYGKDLTNLGPEYSIFVGDLTPDVTDTVLQEFFQQRFPSCKAAKVVLDAAGNSSSSEEKPGEEPQGGSPVHVVKREGSTLLRLYRGYGFVRFFEENEHKRAMTEMQGVVGCGGKPLRVSAATPKRPQTTVSTPAYGTTATTTQYSAQYAQQYQQQYQQYMQAWQGYQYQQPNYYQQYPQYGSHMYGQDYQHQPATHQSYEQDQSGMMAVDTSVQDPNEPIDVAAENKQMAETEAELFYGLESSRWQPMESVSSSPKMVTT